MLASTREAVRALYDSLSSTPAPESVSSARARALAAARGWPVPAWWDEDTIDSPEHDVPIAAESPDVVDEVAVARAIAGDLASPLTTLERHEAVVILHRRGHSDSEIAALLAVSAHTVLRDRGIQGLPGHAVGVAA